MKRILILISLSYFLFNGENSLAMIDCEANPYDDGCALEDPSPPTNTYCQAIVDLSQYHGCRVRATEQYQEYGYVQLKHFKGQNGGNLRNVVYFVSPFLPYQDQSIDDIYSDYWIDSGLAASLNSQDYDVVVFGYSSNAYDYLQNKSNAMISAIEFLNAHREYQDPAVVLGLSLGGVVSRYALSKMEMVGIEHNVRTFISVDSPHRGATIPLSFQYLPIFLHDAVKEARDDNKFLLNSMGSLTEFLDDVIGADTLMKWETLKIHDLHEGMKDAISELGFLADKVSQPVAKQLLINHVSSEGPHVERQLLQSELDSMPYPKKTRNIAVANASDHGLRHTIPSSRYMNFDSTMHNSTTWDLYLSKVNWGNQEYFRGDFRYLTDYLLDKKETHYRRNKFTPYGMVDVEESVCSTSSLPALVNDVLKTQLHDDYGDPVLLEAESCFIPLASALDINTSNYNVQLDLSNSPFDRVYANGTIEGHLSMGQYTDDIASEIRSRHDLAWLIPIITL